MLWHISGFLSFIRLNNIPRYVMPRYLYPFIHQWTFGFHLWAIVNNAAVNMGVQLSLQDLAFYSDYSLKC